MKRPILFLTSILILFLINNTCSDTERQDNKKTENNNQLSLLCQKWELVDMKTIAKNNSENTHKQGKTFMEFHKNGRYKSEYGSFIVNGNWMFNNDSSNITLKPSEQLTENAEIIHTYKILKLTYDRFEYEYYDKDNKLIIRQYFKKIE